MAGIGPGARPGGGRRLRAEDVEALLRSDRHLKLAVGVLLALAPGFVLVLIQTGVDVVVGPGIALGAAIGALLLVPQRRLLHRLGLTPVQAREVLRAEVARRRDRLPAGERARQDARRAGAWCGLTVLLLAVAGVAAEHLAATWSTVMAENSPEDPWFGTSLAAALFALLIAIGTGATAWSALRAAAVSRRAALQQRAAEAGGA